MHIHLIKGPLTLVIRHEDNQDLTSTHTIHLTLTEYQVLEQLLKHQGQHISKRDLIKSGWPNSIVCDNALNMVIMSLRKKLFIFKEIE
ncbi:helix-turn-helix domain-containing protein, partial [Vibrio sp. RE86]|uniref:winged helix-turn-helix domain-containing protein n=1 Tax=Vibrio sp. RE86 TaxID=2607605 RepID=UPI001493662C